MQNSYWIEVTPTHCVPAAPREGRESSALPGDIPMVTGPAQLLAFPLCTPGSRVAGLGENQCMPGKIVYQKVMVWVFLLFSYCSVELKW